eukprot:6295810-Prymnesium_polylepis.1
MNTHVQSGGADVEGMADCQHPGDTCGRRTKHDRFARQQPRLSDGVRRMRRREPVLLCDVLVDAHVQVAWWPRKAHEVLGRVRIQTCGEGDQSETPRDAAAVGHKPRQTRQQEDVVQLVSEEREVREPRVGGGTAQGVLDGDDGVPAHASCECVAHCADCHFSRVGAAWDTSPTRKAPVLMCFHTGRP